MIVSQYFLKVKFLCYEIFKLDLQNMIIETRKRRIIIHGLRSKYKEIVMTMLGWANEPMLIELENILANQENLNEQMSKVKS